MDISRYFNLGKTQAELDFVNVDTDRDTPVFVDPYALEIKEDQWSNRCADHIWSFFTAVLEAIRSNNTVRALHLLSHLHEAQETYLGVSRGRPQGRGIGSGHAAQLLDALQQSRAVQTGLLSDLAEAELFIAGIGRDKISDLTTNIIRGPLVDYTAAQCELHSIGLYSVSSAGPVWDPAREDWVQKSHELPMVARKPVILVPKYSVRRRLSLDSQEFYNHQMINFLAEEYLTASSSLVHTLKNGGRRVYKKDVKERHPFIKNDLADFVRQHPEVLEEYKRLKGAQGPLSITELEKNFDEAALARALEVALSAIAPGSATATKYHHLITGILSFLFFPGLIEPIKEREIHDGRKRIDIKFTNTGTGVFFERVLKAAQTRAVSISVECKNYTTDPANPELDQLSGRFSHTRGFIGFLCCRTLQNKIAMSQRCRDTAMDGRGYVIVLDDDEIVWFLRMVAADHRDQLEPRLNHLYNERGDNRQAIACAPHVALSLTHRHCPARPLQRHLGRPCQPM
jgi:hypothetical protein